METKETQRSLKTKEPLKTGDKLLVIVEEDGSSVIYKAHVTSVSGEQLVYERTDADGSFVKRTGYFRDENVRWCRGWTGKAAQAIRAVVAKTVHQQEQRKVIEQKKFEDTRVAILQTAARIVARAKLPRELRGPAFQIACMGSWGPYGWR